MVGSGRTLFTSTDDDYLAQYIAKYNPQQTGRSGNVLYQRLVANAEGKWGFAKRHSWHSWRDRYLNNRARLDMKINKHIQLARAAQAFVPESSSAPKQATQTLHTREVRQRVPFTTDDDLNLVEYLASFKDLEGARLGQKLYMPLKNSDEYPWAVRHSWQSWRERYKNHEQWFDWAVRRHLADDEDELAEQEPVRPRTSADWLVHRKSSQVRESDPPDKRKRVRQEHEDAPPRKKSRVQRSVDHDDEQPVAGPSKRRETAAEAEQDATDHAHDGPRAEPEPNEVREDAEEPQDVVNDVQEGADENSTHDASSSESSEEDDSDQEDRGSPHSDDYHGEIFESPGQTEDDVQAAGSASDSSEREQAELFHMLTDDPFGEMQPDDVDVDDAADQTLVGRVGADDHEPTTGDGKPILSKTPPSGASPPPRRHHARIERDIDREPATSSPSPTEKADARHHREHDHSPAPARKHPKRVGRLHEEEDFFGTPRSDSSSSSPVEGSSPTAQHLAHVRGHRDDDAADDKDLSQKAREPPRLDEGPWNKALSGARGESRTNPSGKPRRKSGVNFEDEAAVIDDTDEDDDGDDREDEEVEETPIQWPPVRRKDKGKAAAPATPSPAQRADAGRMVTTEKIVSVKTVRTVQRRVPMTFKGTPHPRLTQVAAEDGGEDSPIPAREQPDEDEDEAPEQSQHHPFSQPALPPRMAPSASNDSTGSGTSLVFPRVNGVMKGRAPISKVDLTRLQKMLQTAQDVEKTKPSELSPSKVDRDIKRTASRPLSGADKRLLDGLLQAEDIGSAARVEARRATAPMLSRMTISPPGIGRDDDGERFSKFEEQDEELPPVPLSTAVQSSPLADRGDARWGGRHAIGEMIPHASTSRAAGPAPPLQQEKARPRVPPNIKGHARRYTVGGPELQDIMIRQDTVPRQRANLRQSLPAALGIEDDLLFQPTTFQLFHPSRSGSAHTRSYSLSRPPASSRSISPTRSADASLADTLPPKELDLVMGLGMQCALQLMARNHGFSEEIVRQVYAEARSLEAADHVLRVMRESANDKGIEALSLLAENVDDEHDDELRNEAEEDEEGPMAVDQMAVDQDAEDDEDEVEHALNQERWLQDAVPLAESSRLDASHRANNNFSSKSRNRGPLRIFPVESHRTTGGSAYSPPKHTRAAKHVRQSAGRVRANDTHAMQAETGVNGGGPASVERPTEGDLGREGVKLGQLAQYDRDQWRRLGARGAKIATGKALGQLLQSCPY